MISGQDMLSQELLQRNGIPFEWKSGNQDRWIVLHADQTKPSSLRNLGFRLGHGKGEIQYLVYFRGRFCGVVM